MFQGTGSDVGKSLIVTGLARVFARRGLAVRPFKPQNMSNNAAVTGGGGEIGRAQALQARAAGVAPTVDMNPVLLKPQSETGAQIVVQGKVWGNSAAHAYAALAPRLLAAVLDSFDRIASDADLVLVEGAGSASEINLRRHDIANMGFARAVDAPVVLIGDIERGGVIASLVGTRAVIEPDDAALIVGFIVNRFHGDATLFADGMRAIADRTGWRALGLVPWFDRAERLPAEDTLGLPAGPPRTPEGRTRVAVLAYPRLANFDDFDPLRQEPGIDLVFVRPGQAIPGDVALVVLPGSKSTLADLATLRACGWDIDIRAHHRRGGHVLGICGGYQMLGRRVTDPDGIEGRAGVADGLGMLDVETVLAGDKVLARATGTVVASDVPFTGYEMHVGRTTGPATPLLRLSDGRFDGAVSTDGRISGCYIHGLFGDDRQRRHWLSRLGAAASALVYDAEVESVLEELADHLEAHLDCDGLLAAARVPAR
jgi:adenosylcobyric acid synthase